MLLPSSLAPVARFCEAFGTQHLPGGSGLSQQRRWVKLQKRERWGWVAPTEALLLKLRRHGPRFPLSCRSQLCVDTDSCCCLSVGFALFYFNLSTSFMCPN